MIKYNEQNNHHNARVCTKHVLYILEFHADSLLHGSSFWQMAPHMGVTTANFLEILIPFINRKKTNVREKGWGQID
jgi:hypothetical protein